MDNEYLYFSNTGNWSNVYKLTETSCLNGKTGKNTKRVKTTFYFFFAGSGLLSIFIAVLRDFQLDLISLIGIIGIPALALFAYRYMKTEMGVRYLIPHNKVNSVICKNKEVTFHFLDADNNPCSETMINIDLRGVELLQQFYRDKVEVINEQQPS